MKQKTVFLVSQALSFSLLKQTSKNVADTTFNETPKLESDSEVVNPKRKAKPLLINETQENDRFVIDEEYDIVTEK